MRNSSGNRFPLICTWLNRAKKTVSENIVFNFLTRVFQEKSSKY